MSTATVWPAALTGRLFQDAVWGVSHHVEKQALNPGGLLTVEGVRRLLDASLLKWPYFTLLKHGEVPTVSSYTVQRDVIGHKVAGFADPGAVARHMAGGATLKLNQVADWHRPTRDLAGQLEDLLPVAVNSYLFWTPEESRGMLPHRDAAHVLVVQLEGCKEWHLYAAPEQIGASAGLDVDAARPSHVFTLEPGDVMYLPHGWPHDAIARGGDSMHLTFTLTEPTPEDLIDAFLRRFVEDENNLVHHFHTRALAARTSEVRAALSAQASTLDGACWTRTALETMREAIG
jgi:hypothetical protein